MSEYERPFMDKSVKPALDSLRELLGATFVHYEGLHEEVKDFEQHWGFTKGSGWMLKIEKAKKALGYVIPFKGAFRFSMAIRDSEYAYFLASPDFQPYQDKLKNGRKFSEGHSIYFDIFDESSFLSFVVFIQALIAQRK